MKAAIIGAGKMGEKKAEACKACGIDLVYVDSINEDMVAQICKEQNATSKPWREFINEDIDLIFVCTSHDALKEATVAALNAGKHVCVEKPAGRNSAEVQEIITAHNNALEKKYVGLKVSLNHRFHPAIWKAKELADKGELGELMFMTGEYGHGGRDGMETEWRCVKSKGGGGELLDQGSHIIDLYQWFIGHPDSVNGYAPTYAYRNENEPVEDNCFFRMRTGKKCGHFHVSWTMWKNDFRLKIVGDKGLAVINGLGRHYGKETLTIYKRGAMGKPSESYEYPPGDDPERDESFIDELKYFLECIEEEKQPEGNIKEALDSMKIVESIYSQ